LLFTLIVIAFTYKYQRLEDIQAETAIAKKKNWEKSKRDRELPQIHQENRAKNL
jgi:hypothetical protein